MNLLPQGERLLSGQLSEYLSAVGTTVDVDNPPSSSKLPTYIELAPDSDDPETVRVIDVAGNTITIERGVYNGGIGHEHQANTTWKQKFSQMHWDAVVRAVQTGFLTEDESLVVAQVDNNTFTITGVDRTDLITVGRILRLNGNVLVTVASATYGTGATTVNTNETTVPVTINSLEYAIAPEGADIVPIKKATGAEIDTGTEDAKIVTPKAIMDSNLAYLTDMPVKATGAEIITGTNDAKFTTPKALTDAGIASPSFSAPNLLKNGNFINNSSAGYGTTPNDWTSSNANPIQGGFPEFTKQQLIDLLGITDGDIEGLWNLNGNYTDLSANGYNLTASGSPTDTSDGLMAQAKAFVGASSQYADNASANCRITGSQTWFGFIKPTVIPGAGVDACFLGQGDVTNNAFLSVIGGQARFALTQLTTNQNAYSDVQLEANKWYMVVGIYDSANSKLKIWVNGIKKEVTASGSHTASAINLAIGRLGNLTGQYYTGTVQNAGVLSVALTDTQVRKLWSATNYRGQKVRRATTDAYLYQDLPEDLVERLRGKAITLRASMYQAVASTAQISIDDGTEGASATDATTGSWLNKSVTKTISATATNIRIKIKHSTSDGTSWFKEIAVYEGANVLTYDHSKEDWSRFPSLLRLTPRMMGIYPYRYEENKLNATVVPTNAKVFTPVAIQVSNADLATGGTTPVLITLPGFSSWLAIARAGGTNHGSSVCFLDFYDSADKAVTQIKNSGYQWNGTFAIDNSGNVTFNNAGGGAGTATILNFTFIRLFEL